MATFTDIEYEDEDYEMTELEMLTSAGLSAGTGAVMGAQFGPVGAVAGGVLGLGVGAAQIALENQARQEALVRQLELERELEGVDNLEEYLTATNISGAQRRTEAALGARQAASRMGASEAVGENLAMQARAQEDRAESQRLADAFARANAADRADRQQIMGEEFGFQQLQDMALEGASEMEALGEIGASLSTLAQVQDSKEAEAKAAETKASETEAARTASEGETAETVSSYSGAREKYKRELEFAEDKITRDQESFVEGIPDTPPWMGTRFIGTGENSRQVFHPQDIENKYPERDKASKHIARELKTGAVSTEQYNRVKARNPAALMDINVWVDEMAMLLTSDESRMVGMYDLPPATPEHSTHVMDESFVSGLKDEQVEGVDY